jgi:tetratricopeptide (TPR) repeat protein
MATIPEALAIAAQHHQAGRLQAAEQIYRQVLQAEPNHADAWYLLGVVARQTGKHAIAAACIERAIELKNDVPAFHVNLGEAYRALRRIPEALACYDRALKLNPDSAQTHYNLGNLWREQGKLDEAIACFRRALELQPELVQAHNNLGAALRDQGKLDEAIASCRRALELKPDHATAHYNLGNLLRDQGRPDEALASYRRALELKPDFAAAQINAGNAWKDLDNLDAALACYRRALELRPDSAEAHHNLGNVLRLQGNLGDAVACQHQALAWKPHYAEAHYDLGLALRDQGKLDEAIACFRRAIELKPDYAEAHGNLGNALKDQEDLDGAAVCYRRMLELKPDCAEVYNNLGNALNDQGKHDEAVACFRQALELKPDYAETHYNLGGALEEMGDLAAAEDAFRAALRHDPRFAWAYYKLAEVLGGRLPQQDLAAQHRLLEESGLTDAQRLLLHFGLAHVLDARGEYAEAAQHLQRANALQGAEWRIRGQEYDPQEHQAVVSRMIEVSTPDFFQRVRGFGLDTELPVFVVGLPRSGTTLVEQILASHSQVFGAGEIRLVRDTMLSLGGPGADFIEGLARLDRPTAVRLASRHLERLRRLHAAALRIVDKMPDNYFSLGLLATLFPRAKLIHCRRDLRDVAVSCWMTHFEAIRWANDPQYLASRFQQYQRLMEHWRKVLPVPLLEVDYEETVADLEGVARKLVAWCGLEWEPACLEFQRAKRPVRTVSAVQVRQPVFRTSVGRWKHYQDALEGLFARLPR